MSSEVVDEGESTKIGLLSEKDAEKAMKYRRGSGCGSVGTDGRLSDLEVGMPGNDCR